MSLSEWHVVARILDAALAVEPHARAELLDRHCGSDPELRQEIERLLQSCEREDGFLEASAAAFAGSLLAADSDSDETLQGTTVGPFRLVKRLAHGGMGSVYVAERADGQFEQRVALKVIKRGMDSEEVHRRFLAERRILARLSHPHIARLLDGGMTDGQPWFAMEFVDGTQITRYCDERSLEVEERIRLFAKVCEAVQYAHQNQVIHRDVKPSNILVTTDGQVKLLDFGIAKLLAESSSDAPVTQTEVRVMTPEYAAPEQIRGDPVTSATDVYALGAVLYELLSGTRAHRFERHSASEIERVVCELDPPPPSSATLRETGRGRRLAHDLDTIVLKALQKDPARRYQSAEALADDLRRQQAGLPVLAQPDSLIYRSRKFVRRHRIAALGLVAVVASGLGGMQVAATLGSERASRGRTDPAAAVTPRGTNSTTAYAMYLKGRSAMDQYTEQDFREAVGYFRRAIAEDSGYTDAYAGLSEAYNMLADYQQPRPLIPLMQDAAEKALALAPRSPAAHMAMAFFHHYFDWDWRSAERSYQQAIALDPGYARAYATYSRLLTAVGRTEEAIVAARRAQEIDPLVEGQDGIRVPLLVAGRYEESLADAQLSLRVDTVGTMVIYRDLGLAQLHLGKHTEGIQNITRAAAHRSTDPGITALLGYAYGIAGRHSEARAILGRFLELDAKGYVAPSFIAQVYAGLGEKDSAFIWLERGFLQRSPQMTSIADQSWARSLRGDPRLADLRRRMGLP